MKREVTKADLQADIFSNLSCAVDLLNTLIEEHFVMVDMPEDWGNEYTYNCVSRKIRAVMVIANNAMDQLSVAESGGAGDYFNAKAGLMADIIRGRREVTA